MKKYLEYLISVMIGSLYGISYIKRGQNSDFLIAILEGNFSDFIAFNFGYFTSFMESVIPFILFQMVFGVAIYQHFTTANVYYFTRQNNRKRWFFKEAWKLLRKTGCHMLGFLTGRCIVVQLGNNYAYSEKTIEILLYVWILQTLYVYFFTLIINLCAIRWNSMVGAMVSIGVQVFSIVALYPLKQYSVYMWNGWYFRLNPIANMIVSWHEINGFSKEVNLFQIHFPILFSICYFLIGIGIVFLVGCRWIKKDLLHEYQEE